MRIRTFIVALNATAVSVIALVAGAAGAVPTLTVYGNGAGPVRLGASETTTVRAFTRIFGHPSVELAATPMLKSCGVSATIGWSSMDVFFNHQRFVGLSFGPGHSPSGQTTAGLKLGDSLGRTRALYHKKLTTSTNQGGAWFASTPLGRIDGFLNPSTGRIAKASTKIWTIDIGVVGCPAQSP